MAYPEGVLCHFCAKERDEGFWVEDTHLSRWYCGDCFKENADALDAEAAKATN